MLRQSVDVEVSILVVRGTDGKSHRIYPLGNTKKKGLCKCALFYCVLLFALRCGIHVTLLQIQIQYYLILLKNK